jgi:hypothetical protein
MIHRNGDNMNFTLTSRQVKTKKQGIDRGVED